MILKSSGRKGSYASLVNYMLRDAHLMRDDRGDVVVFRHNVIGKLPETIIAEFERNDEYRRYRAKNANRYTHDILSWHELDKHMLTEELIMDLAAKYVQLRGSDGMYFGVIHTGEHPHLHIMLSANAYESEDTMRISKQRFSHIRKELQAYEELTYKLPNSVVNYEGKSNAPSDKEWQFEKRTGAKSRKEELREIVRAAHEGALSREEFYNTLKHQGLEPYARGSSEGIVDNELRFRLATLGLSRDELETLDSRHDQVSELESIRHSEHTTERYNTDIRLADIDKLREDEMDL
ncbi:MAG: relaxase/mobilization nuclease domain-containing protein [Bacteroidetes bacterium]|nr:relaxase/mobilization nuclease domain-containing protein [Bacteroidota bacterium]